MRSTGSWNRSGGTRRAGRRGGGNSRLLMATAEHGSGPRRNTHCSEISGTGAACGGAHFPADGRSHNGAEQLDGPHDLVVRHGPDAHLDEKALVTQEAVLEHDL